MNISLRKLQSVGVLFIVLVLWVGTARAQYVTIPDTNFVKYLKFTFPACMNGNQLDTSCNAILTVKGVYCSSGKISSLEGIQYFKNIDTLYCFSNPLTFIPSFPPLLKIINASGCDLSSLPALPAMISWCRFRYNKLTLLSSLPASLKYLDVSNNKFVSMPVLPTGMDEANFSYNKLSSLPALPDSKVVNISNNQLSALPVIPLGIGNLDCSYNTLSNLSVLPSTLTLLSCDNNQLTSLPTLPNILTSLVCGSNKLSYLPTLPGTLKTLSCNHNLLSNLPALPEGLSSLDCGKNNISQLPSLTSRLQRLVCDSNHISYIPPFGFASNPYVYSGYIDCSDNLLTNLDISNGWTNTVICRNNPLTSLGNIGGPALDYLDFSGCIHITCLPELWNIDYLYFSNTGINCLSRMPVVNKKSIPDVNTIPLCTSTNSGCAIDWNISGYIYFDTDRNCNRKASEQLFSPAKVNLYQGGNLVGQAYTNGAYSFKQTEGSYTIAIDTMDLPVTVSCQSSFDTSVILQSVDSLIPDVNFGLNCKQGFDIGAWAVRSSTVFFPGRITNAFISAGDPLKKLLNISCGTSGLSGEVKIIIDGPVFYVGPVGAAMVPTVSGNTLTYSISSFYSVDVNRSFGIALKTDTSATIGDNVCITVIVTPLAGDNNPANNTLYHCFELMNSYDPNMKEVSPVGDVPVGYTDWFTYTVHFQNTGNYAAQNIRLLDTLDNNLDASTFQLLNYSVMPVVNLNSNIVSFFFPDIELPDSMSNPEGSKGFVQYRVKPKTGRSVANASIANSASIYFDYNSPIRTNTVSSTFTVKTGIKEVEANRFYLKLHPNPATNQLMLNVSEFRAEEVGIYDVSGRRVLQSRFEPQIDISALAAGVYMVEARAGHHIARNKFVKVSQ